MNIDGTVKSGCEKGTREGPLLPIRISDEMWEVLLWGCEPDTEIGFDSIEWAGFEENLLKPLDKLGIIVGVEEIPKELFPEGIDESFAVGWIQIFGAITDFVRQKKVPSEGDIHQLIMQRNNCTIKSVGHYDPRYHSHFLNNGGRVKWAMKAVFQHATNIDMLGDTVKLIVEESTKWNDTDQFFKECVANLESARIAFLGLDETGVRLNYDSTGNENWPVVEKRETPYGLVYVAEGWWQGRFGYYDDDEIIMSSLKEDDEDAPAKWCAIVYFGVPLFGRYWRIPHSQLRQPPFDGAFTSC